MFIIVKLSNGQTREFPVSINGIIATNYREQYVFKRYYEVSPSLETIFFDGRAASSHIYAGKVINENRDAFDVIVSENSSDGEGGFTVSLPLENEVVYLFIGEFNRFQNPD